MSSHGFILVKEEEVQELASKVKFYKHKKSGAELLSFVNNDENKVFGVSFRTPPADSTGVAHILEHSVLCGSEKYPVKEPFVELLKGSLQTFLNAFTYPDKTCYPVASANEADFRNLIDVYLDAVFFPVISEEIFRQEGWHLTAEKSQGPFSFKGVVYNEMKGAFSSPESVLNRYSLNALFPDTVYAQESGGDPAVIPDLTYEAFKSFHASYYHPSNGRFFFWGDDNEEDRLTQVGEVLNRFTAIELDSTIDKQKAWAEPRTDEVSFASSGNDKGMVVVNWLGPDVMEVYEGLALRMLDHILIGQPASPLRRALIESGLGEDLAGSGLTTELRQLTFDVGLKGVNPEKAKEIETLILKTLQELVDEGIPATYIEAGINTVEFELRENNTGRFPVGLAVMLRSLTTWLHDGDPLAPLRFEESLTKIKNAVAKKEPIFEELIKKWFLDNAHRLTVSLKPDAELSEKMSFEEKERVDAFITNFDDSGRKELVEKAEYLEKWQAEPDQEEDLARIPRLGLKDMPQDNQTIPYSWYDETMVPSMFHGLATGGIVYSELAFDLAGVENTKIPYLPLLGRAILEMGTKSKDFVELNMDIARKTGGIDSSCLFMSSVEEVGQSRERFILTGKTTPDKLTDLFDLMVEVLLEADLDQKDRFLRMVLEEKARQEHRLIPAGHMVVASRLMSGFSHAGALSESTGGISYILFLRSLIDKIQEDWSLVLKDLEDLRDAIFTRSGLIINNTALEEQKKEIIPLVNSLASKLKEGAKLTPAQRDNRVLAGAEALIVPAQVNYAGKGINLFAHGYKWHGSARVILKYLRTGYLWENVRVRGGAYGCMCGLNRASGGLYFVSYRDPSILPTLKIYDDLANYLQNNEPQKAALDTAIVGAIGELDAYLLPDAKGRASFSRYLSGDSEELRQTMREEILNTQAKDFKTFGEAMMDLKDYGVVCALGGDSLREVADDGGWDILPII